MSLYTLEQAPVSNPWRFARSLGKWRHSSFCNASFLKLRGFLFRRNDPKNTERLSLRVESFRDFRGSARGLRLAFGFVILDTCCFAFGVYIDITTSFGIFIASERTSITPLLSTAPARGMFI